MRYFKGGGGSSAPTETTVTQTDLPEYVQPYFERLLKRGEAESNQPYSTYGGESLKSIFEEQTTGSGFTASLQFESESTDAPYSLDAVTLEYAEHTHS